ncbi:MAG: protein-methionine-sulfoxide reductase catalytic subunit MsrP [Proteobacteria bacterium]|jgi:sulfoxide reductase catalytic subunit YedY|nr:protein-methionine-sulfoxide reductase catalytic subunit MsrP [Pseudomonadota bacterium]
MKFETPRILPSDITSRDLFLDRRRVLRYAAAGAAFGALGAGVSGRALAATIAAPGAKLAYTPNAALSIKDPPNSYEDITTYNNFYEFGTDKSDPAVQARDFKPLPWKVTVDGEAEVKGSFDFEDILRPLSLEERIYRLRCVEAWSMVIPWTGFPLAELIKRFKPTSKAKYVEFTTLMSPKQMPGQRYPVLDWPYVEGLRMDEAMHPLTFIAVGVYGQMLPNQCGAPLRLVVPWKYGFKGIKSIVRIRFTELQPKNSWQVAAPSEYGFFANVNPSVDHPRWSQATERRIGGSLLAKRAATLPFNGYAEQVASLYKGMDLRRNF